MPDRGQDFQADALILDLARAGIMRAAIDSDLVTTRCEPGREMLRECFKAAIVCGDTPRAENRDTHKLLTGLVTSKHKNTSHVEGGYFSACRPLVHRLV